MHGRRLVRRALPGMVMSSDSAIFTRVFGPAVPRGVVMTGQRCPAFSRLDALVVVVGLGLALALAVPFVLRARLHAKREQSADNLKRLVLAMYDYIDNHDGWLPPGCDDKHFSAVAKILPYLGQQDLHKRIDYSKRITDPVNQAARR